VAQVRTATACLVPVWHRKGRCSRQRAEAISRRLLTTQQRNTLAARSHRKRTLQLLHARGVFLKNLRMCHWPNLVESRSGAVTRGHGELPLPAAYA
jgi:hypothetical protein